LSLAQIGSRYASSFMYSIRARLSFSRAILLYVDMGRTAVYGIGDSKFRRILEMTFPNAARPSSFADGSGVCGSALRIGRAAGHRIVLTSGELSDKLAPHLGRDSLRCPLRNRPRARAFRSRCPLNRRRESQRDVSGFETSRNRLH